jgi:hypothetical protein
MELTVTDRTTGALIAQRDLDPRLLGFRKIPTDTLAHKILIPVKVPVRPPAAPYHPVSPLDRFQSQEGITIDH